MTGECFLVSNTYTEDEYLNRIPTQVPRPIICDERSVYSSEWHEAKQNGLSPSLTLVTAKVNYNGESTLIYKGKTFNIYRTYQVDDDIELYCEEVAGK